MRINIGCSIKAIFKEFTEEFESNWFVDNSGSFISLFTENFESNWFVDNSGSFISLFTEDFQNGGW